MHLLDVVARSWCDVGVGGGRLVPEGREVEEWKDCWEPALRLLELLDCKQTLVIFVVVAVV